MACVRPPLLKKPARGFAWSCAACSRDRERKLEARHTGNSQHDGEEDLPEEEEEDSNGHANGTGVSTPAAADEAPRPATEEQTAQAKMWPFRYLGMHCQVEDALDYDDRIYPRASSRLGPRHQAIVNDWGGRPVEYVKRKDTKRKYMRTTGGRKDSKLSKDALAAIKAAEQEKANRPKYVLDEPPGYVQRGEDEPVSVDGKQVRTSQLLFKMPTSEQIPARGEDDPPGADLNPADREKFIDEYMAQAKQIAPEKGLEKHSTNFLDKALEVLYAESYDVKAALTKLRTLKPYTDFKEPHLRPEELKLFEQAVGKYGSELRLVTKHVKSVPHYQIVRFYYMWKKTPRGRQIWGQYEGRRGKKDTRRSSIATKLADDVADDHDDSAFDNNKAADKKRGFVCKFCSTRASRQWRRAPGIKPDTMVPADPNAKRDKGLQLVVALCSRCAMLWRKYSIQWEDVDDVVRKINQGGNKSLRRRFDEELLAQLLAAGETPGGSRAAMTAAAAANGTDGRKKGRDKDSAATSATTSVEPAPKKKVEKPPEPIVPEPPRAKALPCAVCSMVEPMNDERLTCRDCRLTVHRSCYGVSSSENSLKWLCDMCTNDRSPTTSTRYECVLCPVAYTEQELMEGPTRSHKKKTERDREKERLEKELVNEAVRLYHQRQESAGKPVNPREPLKRTVGNNWVHVNCAVWTPEVKFGSAKALEPAEGFGLIPAERYREACKLCKTKQGACVGCHHNSCNARFHIGCALQAQYRFGFDITPVKSSRRDSVNSVHLGNEVGAATPAIWCAHHNVTSIVHGAGDSAGQAGLTALQLFCQTYKQADLNLTGTVRKAAYIQQSVQHPTRANGVTALHGHRRESSGDTLMMDAEPYGDPALDGPVKRVCCRCSTEFSPRWWPVEQARPPVMNGLGMSGSPFHARHSSHHSVTANGDYAAGATAYECHKCHIKNPTPQMPPARPPLPTPRVSEYSLPYGPGTRPMAMGSAAEPTSPDIPPGYEHRSGPTYHGPQMNGYQSVPGYYTGATPGPAYPSPVPLVPMTGAPPGLTPRPYAPSASPPEARARPSPQHSHSHSHSQSQLSTSPRVYSSERVVGGPMPSPGAGGQMEARGPTSPEMGERAGSATMNGASASPSLKNLLS